MGDEEQSEQFVLELYQWMLPKNVCFKGDNGKYLSAQSLHNKPFLVFESEEINDPTVRHTTTANRDGTMRIKSDHLDRFWRNSGSTGTGSWIHADSTDDTSNDDDPNTLFQAFYTGGAIGILNQGSNQYCKRLTTKNVEHGLSATGTRFEAWSRLQFEEPVVSREIDHVQFRRRAGGDRRRRQVHCSRDGVGHQHHLVDHARREAHLGLHAGGDVGMALHGDAQVPSPDLHHLAVRVRAVWLPGDVTAVLPRAHQLGSRPQEALQGE